MSQPRNLTDIVQDGIRAAGVRVDGPPPLARALRDADRETPLQRSLREGTVKPGRIPDVECTFKGQRQPHIEEAIRDGYRTGALVLPVPDAEAAAEKGVRQLLDLVADDACRSGLEDTPARVVRAYQEMTVGYDVDIEALLARQFDEIEYDGMVVLRSIDFVSLCEHHLLPFTGTATVAYIPAPGGPVVGLSKLARLVEAYARRLQVQERMTTQITTALDRYLDGQGSACQLTASHSCMTVRGVRKDRAQMVTSSLTGAFRSNPETRSEFLALARR